MLANIFVSDFIGFLGLEFEDFFDFDFDIRFLLVDFNLLDRDRLFSDFSIIFSIYLSSFYALIFFGRRFIDEDLLLFLLTLLFFYFTLFSLLLRDLADLELCLLALRVFLVELRRLRAVAVFDGVSSSFVE
jgi:hypothetical protein